LFSLAAAVLPFEEPADNVLPAGVVELPAGVVELPAGVVELPAGVDELPAGVDELPAGVVELAAGTVELPLDDDAEVPPDAVVDFPDVVLPTWFVFATHPLLSFQVVPGPQQYDPAQTPGKSIPLMSKMGALLFALSKSVSFRGANGKTYSS
jgi:hypothetical protein